MSEKQFKLLSGGFDEEGNPLYRIDTTDMLGNYEICKKVIEQQATISDLKEENEQLRHEIEIEKKWQLAQDKYYVKIKEENEQLQKELDNFKPIMFKNMQKGTIILYSKGGIDE